MCNCCSKCVKDEECPALSGTVNLLAPFDWSISFLQSCTHTLRYNQCCRATRTDSRAPRDGNDWRGFRKHTNDHVPTVVPTQACVHGIKQAAPVSMLQTSTSPTASAC